MDKLLILDIDETLVHATQKDIGINHDFETDWYFVYKRPFLHEFLGFCFENFKVAVWTSAGEDFAEVINDKLLSQYGNLEFLWSNEKCTPRLNPETFETIPIKNLDKLKKKGYTLDQIIMVDDTPEKLLKHYGNLVRVTEFRGQQQDTELLKLIQYLKYIKEAPNIRNVEKRGWQNRYTI